MMTLKNGIGCIFLNFRVTVTHLVENQKGKAKSDEDKQFNFDTQIIARNEVVMSSASETRTAN